MSKLDSRLERLERVSAPREGAITAISRTFVSPGHDEAVDEGVGIITVLNGGGRFDRKDYASDAAFWDAANERHQEVFGKPLEQVERTTK